MMKYLFSDVGEFCSPTKFKREPVSIAAAAIGGAALLGSAAWENSVNNAANKRQINATARENQLQRDWLRGMWDANNNYNLPIRQKERLQQAGINPFLNSSAGSVQAGNSSTPSAPSLQSYPTPIPSSAGKYGQAINQFVSDYANLSNQERVSRSTSSLQYSLTVLNAADAYSKILKAGGDKDKAYDVFSSILKSAGHSEQMITDLDKSINYDFLQAKIQSDRNSLEYFMMNNFGQQKAQKELNKIDKEIDHLDEQIESLKKGRELSDAQIADLAQSAAKKLEETLTIRQSREYVVQKLEYEAEILKNDPMRSEMFSGLMKGSGIIANVTKFISLLIKLLK